MSKEIEGRKEGGYVMKIHQRMLFLIVIIVAVGLLSGFSSAEADWVQAERVSSGDPKADIDVLKGAIELMKESGEINDATARNFQLQLTAIDYYLEQGNVEKALQQLKRFEVLVENHQYAGNISSTRGIMIRKITRVMTWDWEAIFAQ